MLAGLSVWSYLLGISQLRTELLIWSPETRLTTVGLRGLPTYNFLEKNVVRQYFMLQVVINFALVKGLVYDQSTPTFHQWRDQNQVYGLNFVSEQDAQVFGNGVFTSLENLQTIGKAFKCCSNFIFIPHAVSSVSVKT